MRTGRRGHPQAYINVVVKSSHEGILTQRELCEAHGISTATLAKWRKESGTSRLRGIPPACHPERPIYAKGKCRSCYGKARYAEGSLDILDIELVADESIREGMRN
jgi:transposase-like protein